MNFFSKILEKIGLRKEEPAKPAAPVAATPAPKPAVDKGEKDNVAAAAAPKPVAPAQPVAPIAPAQPAKPVAISEVDVVKNIEKLAAGSGLNWKVSIVDLLKILDIDSSREARNALATELGCPADLMHDSAKMNVWLHKEVLRKIAENGGNIPQDLLD
ncbi:MAG: DUF3597 domain-containing protein [Anaerolineales bacterium]|nr:DUF3597 domain-containing protein [Anaerolineales bacterium]